MKNYRFKIMKFRQHPVNQREYAKQPTDISYADFRDEAAVKANQLWERHGMGKVEVILLRGFRHGKPMRWLYDEVNLRLIPVAHYDETAGTGDLLKEASNGH